MLRKPPLHQRSPCGKGLQGSRELTKTLRSDSMVPTCPNCDCKLGVCTAAKSQTDAGSLWNFLRPLSLRHGSNQTPSVFTSVTFFHSIHDANASNLIPIFFRTASFPPLPPLAFSTRVKSPGQELCRHFVPTHLLRPPTPSSQARCRST